MSENLYLETIPKIRVYEKSLLDESRYNRMIESEKIEDVLRILSETCYGENLSEDISVSNYERSLTLEFEKTISYLTKLFNDKKLIEIFISKYKYNNLKIMLKSKFLGKSIENIDNILFKIDDFDNKEIYNNVINENFKSIPEEFSGILKKVVLDFEDNKSPQNIDILIDNYMFENLKLISKYFNDNFLNKYVEILIDVFNLKSLFRLRDLNSTAKLLEKVLVSGGNITLRNLRDMFSDPKENIVNRLSVTNIYSYIKEGLESYINHSKLDLLDKELDNYLMQYLKNSKIITSGLAPIVGYINGKENEIRNLRIVLVGKINKVSNDSIKRRLRLSYV